MYDPISSVAFEAQKNRANMKKEKQTLFLLEKAYKSALTKLGSLTDQMTNGTTEEKIRFQKALEEEMMKDCHSDNDYQTKLSAFIISKLK